MEKVTLNVLGMSCGHCVKAIEGSVGELPGVSNVKVYLESGKVDVEYSPTEVSLDKIKETIDDQGYDVN
ncbi:MULTISPECIES: copper chaperone CopZ [Bacillaceae]|jgi:copper chaperone|uniref:Copper chaperone CopZ n=1 Tax=Mesobacillus jeotgali TaxID=129985 RepID=A0ABY9VAT9_9BACI|nr:MULTISPECIES: copper chaperone CopZ [Bacillaceae]MBT2692363.1 copper chaperone CopZ [Bacillus sp. ISL-55]MCM3576101.1 copper chaperone CopZ [Mesobacillus subterraneus]UYZ19957.1 copper chaperone CopZ [Mesobacillus jeotgali]WNF20895.1 copper chaperone CopZ [Mesobacillus jeotgali]